ncbi:MAG: glycine oxidase ThiO [Elainellaceae cyanobacterium]
MKTTSDILVIGGGIVGLAIATELRLRGATVTVLSRDIQQAATQAAAGMLAPQAEGIPASPMLDFCLESRSLYPEWVRKLEEVSGISAGYWACGILAPVYEVPTSTFQKTRSLSSAAQWLDQTAIHQAQPGLGDEVLGGWWFPEDAQVNNRALAQSLRSAAQGLGVNLQAGINVEFIQQHQGRVVSVKTSQGDWTADHYVVATGAWAQELLPVPVQPQKGQMLSVRVPTQLSNPLPLRRVLFGSEIYIVPRQDGTILIGATVESVGFAPNNTPLGLQTLLSRAIHLFPRLQEFPIQECWWGFRPSTPDDLPILGPSQCENLTLAIGHHRNGILLAPATARLIADWVFTNQTSPLLQAFQWDRFYAQPGLLAHQASDSLPPSSSNSSIEVLSPASPHSESTMQTLDPIAQPTLDQPLTIAGRVFQSRLMTGTGKYRTFEQMRQSIEASGSQIVTVAVRRVQTNAPGHEGLADALDWQKLWMLPNTAGCKTADEAIRVARLGREMAKLLGQEDNNFVKLEVIPDVKYLLPDPIGTLEAAEQLIKEGFAVLPYINADPMLAKRLEDAGCATVMPLGSPIGSGQGIRNAANIQIIIENASVPVVVDAGIGAPSEAAYSMELGADALLINTAIAQAKNPIQMGRAMGLATEAGRMAFLAGRIPLKAYASASSPLTGLIT